MKVGGRGLKVGGFGLKVGGFGLMPVTQRCLEDKVLGLELMRRLVDTTKPPSPCVAGVSP